MLDLSIQASFYSGEGLGAVFPLPTARTGLEVGERCATRAAAAAAAARRAQTDASIYLSLSLSLSLYIYIDIYIYI